MKSTVELMKELAIKHNVLYIDYAYSFKDVFFHSLRNRYIPVRRILGLQSPLEKIELQHGGHLHVLSLLPVIPYHWLSRGPLFNGVQYLNGLITNKRIKTALRKLGMNNPIVVNAFNPYFNINKTSIGSKATLYYCYDNIAACPWTSKHGAHLESTFMKHSDAIIFSSLALQEEKQPNQPSYVVTNGVDLNNFSEEKTALLTSNPSESIQIGYIGSIDDRLDYDLLFNTFKQFTTWRFHFIGRMNGSKAKEILLYDNVVYHGAIDPSLLPMAMINFNAGIIPFIRNEQTKNIYPMKANEYLAMGIPVIMTDFACLSDLDGWVKMVPSYEFAHALQTEIEDDHVEKQMSRKLKASQNSWKQKAIEFETILLQYA